MKGFQVHRLKLYLPCTLGAIAMPLARHLGPIFAMIHLSIPLRPLDHPECSTSGPGSLAGQQLVARQSCSRAFVRAALRVGKSVPDFQQPFDGSRRSDHDRMLADWCDEDIACVPGKARPGVTILSLQYAAVFDTMTPKTAVIDI